MYKEETPAGAERPAAVLLPLSGADHRSVAGQAERYDRALADGARLADLAYTAGALGRHGATRVAGVLSTAGEARQWLADIGSLPPQEPLPGDAAGRLVFVFSGQGNQWLGMGRGLAAEPAAREVLDESDDVLTRLAGWSVTGELAATAETSRLQDPAVLQPVLVALQIAVVRLLESWGVIADACVGHSLGEIPAAVACGALTLEDALGLAAVRGAVTREVGGGRTALLGVGADEAADRIARHGGDAEIAAWNSPRSTLIAGSPETVEGVVAELAAAEVFARLLPGSVAFHSRYVAPAHDKLAELIGGLVPGDAHTTLVSAVTGAPVTGRELGPAYWRANLREPVRFLHALRHLAGQGHRAFVEIGAHPTLSPSIAESLTGSGALVVPTLRRDVPAREALLTAAGRLYEAGAALDFSALSPPDRRPIRLPLTTPPLDPGPPSTSAAAPNLASAPAAPAHGQSPAQSGSEPVRHDQVPVRGGSEPFPGDRAPFPGGFERPQLDPAPSAASETHGSARLSSGSGEPGVSAREAFGDLPPELGLWRAHVRRAPASGRFRLYGGAPLASFALMAGTALAACPDEPYELDLHLAVDALAPDEPYAAVSPGQGLIEVHAPTGQGLGLRAMGTIRPRPARDTGPSGAVDVEALTAGAMTRTPGQDAYAALAAAGLTADLPMVEGVWRAPEETLFRLNGDRPPVDALLHCAALLSCAVPPAPEERVPVGSSESGAGAAVWLPVAFDGLSVYRSGSAGWVLFRGTPEAPGAGHSAWSVRALDGAGAVLAAVERLTLERFPQDALAGRAAALKGKGDERQALDLDALAAADPDERAARISGFLRAELGRVLRLPAARVDTDRPLNALGLDSVMGLELQGRLEAALGVEVKVVKLLRGDTVTEVAAELAARIGPDAEAASAPAAGLDDPREIERLLANLDTLPAEEVDALLQRLATGTARTL
ncbi:acyltransferase domain-containing protein [Nonomuraea phyllanthi]|uniref:acyltransferase domain-containing protein n=1 Tax=Nonomuraea phyllanthi TaxID=2219224 RepID=UPI0012938EAC|nr:acyltransferase domain-containing protein [Nonomuraea phyllanthi]QFY07530.1 acyltransferase domain-containing protein [Nonomuraea phyllanthi]